MHDWEDGELCVPSLVKELGMTGVLSVLFCCKIPFLVPLRMSLWGNAGVDFVCSEYVAIRNKWLVFPASMNVGIYHPSLKFPQHLLSINSSLHALLLDRHN
jgi:hypothetical protein